MKFQYNFARADYEKIQRDEALQRAIDRAARHQFGFTPDEITEGEGRLYAMFYVEGRLSADEDYTLWFKRLFHEEAVGVFLAQPTDLGFKFHQLDANYEGYRVPDVEAE